MAAIDVSGNLPAIDNPTVRPYEDFNVEADAEALRAAMKGTGTEEALIIEIVSHRSNEQRQEIEKMYKTMFGKDLIKDLCSELSGNLEETIMALFKSPAYYDTWSLHKAMKGIGTDDDVLIEILATRENDEIAAINECYKEIYGKTLEEKISSETSGKYKRLLVALCQGNRNEVSDENYEIASRQDAEKLYKAGEKKLGTDESMFIQILGLRNYYQISAIVEEYQEIAGKELRESIKSEMSGNLAKGLTAIVDSSHPPTYFAKKLKKAMSGIGTDDSTLIRIIVSRSEIDLADIKQIFDEDYGKSLQDAISSDTSGKYKKLLLALCG
ncbi:hypothetical protein LOTGIDRAFT_131243 [Lottia gigantea]|uniref:Annexin n=1 Tax=Lottia gigantea TaxID=225164 RepID=V3ZQZ4_LOTGI|nr:hypothetical protein LOTGIDRAFT_131243 [Lottia gigantea]ESO84940.1 hypothetical protein LOTGIDRAFT_131243 [Lottia gigantea]